VLYILDEKFGAIGSLARLVFDPEPYLPLAVEIYE